MEEESSAEEAPAKPEIPWATLAAAPKPVLNGKTPFCRWFIATQATAAKTEIWQSFFKDFISAVLVSVYAYMTINEIQIPPGFDLLLGMVLGFYFKSNRDTSVNHEAVHPEELGG